jgi:hypothetical protein
MKKIEDYRVPDLQRPNTIWTFVLESPHRDEIRLGYPAAGDSGKIMSEVLLGEPTPFGQLLQENNPMAAGYSIMNASCIPLQDSCYYEPHFREEILEISNARYTGQDIGAAKIAVKRVLDSPIGKRITLNLNLRILRQLGCNPSGSFIVCGVVAQSIFEIAMSVEGWFHKSIVVNLEGKEATVFYENHPSSQSGEVRSKWKDPENMKPLLQFLCRQ